MLRTPSMSLFLRHDVSWCNGEGKIESACGVHSAPQGLSLHHLPIPSRPKVLKMRILFGLLQVRIFKNENMISAMESLHSNREKVCKKVLGER